MTVWPSFRQAWAVDAAAHVVLLGDLSAYVSLSGYRLRLTEHGALLGGAPEEFVVVGMPDEKVELTYLRRVGSRAWKVHVQTVVVGADGRAPASLA